MEKSILETSFCHCSGAIPEGLPIVPLFALPRMFADGQTLMLLLEKNFPLLERWVHECDLNRIKTGNLTENRFSVGNLLLFPEKSRCKLRLKIMCCAQGMDKLN